MIMRVSVVHESMVGNTRQIAEAIGASLAESGDVAALEVSAATAGAAEGRICWSPAAPPPIGSR